MQKKRFKDTVTCTVKTAEVKVRHVPETCKNGESDSDIEFLKEVPGTFPRPRVHSQEGQNRSERYRSKGIS